MSRAATHSVTTATAAGRMGCNPGATPPFRVSRPLQLRLHRGEVEVVPPFDELPVAHPGDAHAGELHRPLRGSEAERVATMRTAHRAPDRDLVTFDDAVLDDDLHVGKRGAERGEERKEC